MKREVKDDSYMSSLIRGHMELTFPKMGMPGRGVSLKW